MNARKVPFITLIVVLILILSTFAASAANAHFIYAKASGPDRAGALLISFKIAGLGNNFTTTITVSGNASALYACRNRGGNFPSDPKKQQVSGPVANSGVFTSGKNGQITGSLRLTPPPSSLVCPSGQSVVLVWVTYTNVQVSAPVAGAQTIPGTFSRTYYTLR